jgi:hypothetical protein
MRASATPRGHALTPGRGHPRQAGPAAPNAPESPKVAAMVFNVS